MMCITRCCLVLTLVLLPLRMSQANPLAMVQLRTEIALTMSSFFEFNDARNTPANYCLFSRQSSAQAKSSIVELGKRIQPPILIKFLHEFDAKDCQFLLIDSELTTDILLMSQSIKTQTLVIGYGHLALQYGADVALVRNGNHVEIEMHVKKIRAKKITPHPQLLKMAKVLNPS